MSVAGPPSFHRRNKARHLAFTSAFPAKAGIQTRASHRVEPSGSGPPPSRGTRVHGGRGGSFLNKPPPVLLPPHQAPPLAFTSEFPAKAGIQTRASSSYRAEPSGSGPPPARGIRVHGGTRGSFLNKPPPLAFTAGTRPATSLLPPRSPRRRGSRRGPAIRRSQAVLGPRLRGGYGFMMEPGVLS